MRSKSKKSEYLGAFLAIDENKVRLDVAIAMLFPFTGEWMIVVFGRKRLIVGKKVEDYGQNGGYVIVFWGRTDSSVVSLEGARSLNLAH